MASSLASVLANIFMGFQESKWLNEHNLNKSKFYFRYVDDISAAFHNEQDSKIKNSSNQNQLKNNLGVHYFKLPYIGNLSHNSENKVSKLCKDFCKENFNIKLVFH